MRKAYIFISIVIFLLGFGAGYSTGYVAALNWGVNVFEGLMDAGFIDVNIDKDILVKAMWQYEGQIGGCLFANKTAYNMTGK